jgi:type IV fimbrial biogenesis protein FimT
MARVEFSQRNVAARGFGLIELLVAIAIVAILTAAAVPSFREMSRRMAVSETSINVVAALNSAKSEAVKRGVIAGVVGSGNDWSAAGFQVLADNNRDGTLDGSDATPDASGFSGRIAQYAGLNTGYRLTTKVTGGGDAQVIFGAQGALQTPITQADFNVCRPDSQPLQSTWIHVEASGAISSRKDTTTSPAPGC